MRSPPRLRPALLAALVGLAASCADDAPRPYPRQRLLELPGTLHAGPRGNPHEVLRQDFDALPDDWHVITSTLDVLDARSGVLERALGHEDGRSYLSLSGRQGALYQLLDVEPGTPYLFRGTLRARGVVPAAQPFSGAYFWVAESSKTGSPAELFGQGKRFDLLHKLPGALGHEGWLDVRIAFRTRLETKTLIAGCVLAVDNEVRAGAVDFDRMHLVRLDEREYWEYLAAEAVAQARRGAVPAAADDWRARRALEALLGAEQRPAVLSLPGERLEFELTVPEGEPVLTFGCGPWPAAPAGAEGRLVPWVRVDGRELFRLEERVVPGKPVGWRDVMLELEPWSARRVRLELGMDGDQPGVFGAPVVHAREATPPGWNVLFVSIDTLRAERVGAYGGTSGATPNLDALARESLVFEAVQANAPYTLPAHATLFSGQFPCVHAVEDRDRRLSARRSPILAQELAARGWRTQAFAAGGFLAPEFGFHLGFDGFSLADPLRHPGSAYFGEFARHYPDQDIARWTPAPTTSPVRAWLAAHASEPFFLFLHTYEVHDYDPPPGPLACAAEGCRSTLTDFRELLFPRQKEPFPGTEADRAHLLHLYDAALRHVDAQIGAILDDLRALGLLERTVIVVTSDHGEEWFERGRLQHGKTLYGEQLRIPWILRVPGRAPDRLSTPAMQVDVLPTLLGALGIAPDPRVQGVDLLAGESRARPLWAEVDDKFAAKTSLRLGDWKLVHGPLEAEVAIRNERTFELFDLARDPGEREDLAEREPARLAELRAQLEAFREHLRGLGEGLGPVQTDSELEEGTQRLLEHLGY